MTKDSVNAVAPTRRYPRLASSRRAQRGVSSIMFAILLIPLLLAVGLAVDVARMVQFRSDLQNAVDEAALAGAAAFMESTQSALATTVATTYFKRAILPASVSVSAPTVTPNANDTINPALGNAPAHTVTVTATATANTTLMSLVAPSLVTFTVTAKAANPVVSANLSFPKLTSNACDGNTLYLYQVPGNSTNTGYDYSKVPVFNSTNYYQIYTSYSPTVALGKTPDQTLPTFSVNQPLGVMLRNDTNGNVGNPNCQITVTGANSYGAPSGSSQTFYSSLLMNGQSPSELTNYTYTASVTTSGSKGTNVVSYTVQLPPSTLYPNGKTISGKGSDFPGGSNQLAMVFGVNAPGSANSNCQLLSTSTSGSQTTKQYSCTTQYRKSTQTTASNCSLYVQTGSGVTSSYLNGLTPQSSAPSSAVGNCFDVTSGGANNSAPSCAQLSALASGSGSAAVQPAAVFWWDDAGGEGANEADYGASSHCSQIRSSSSAGYGEDCQYKNMVAAVQCQATGGSGTGYTAVVLTQ
ncbi:MAG TPA: pilus assembly protein TadG-related protein [Paraburkholderia sp.]|jgi:Flp pilus assembly protein TadG|nr:pilus assembly protein TadG-related protein [Paraburkholderia sp.]